MRDQSPRYGAVSRRRRSTLARLATGGCSWSSWTILGRQVPICRSVRRWRVQIRPSRAGELVVRLLCTSRGPIGSYYQLAVVVPLIAIVLLAGGIGAVINGHTATGIVVIDLERA